MTNQPDTKLLNGCISILEEYCKPIHRRISLIRNGDSFFSLNCNYGVTVNYNGNDFNVARFRNLDNLGFNFALKFNIVTNSPKRLSFDLTDANLKIFYLNDIKSQLLFRAEFAINSRGQLHAQPHWQFEPYITKAVNENIFNTVLELRYVETQMIDFEPDTTINISKIHFARTSDWHKPKKEQISGADRVLINNENVVHWLGGCMNYIQNQAELLR